MFWKNRPKPTTVHYDHYREFYVADDGTLYQELPLATGSPVEMEVRYIMALLLRQFADLLSAGQRPPQAEQIIDVAFESDLESGST